MSKKSTPSLPHLYPIKTLDSQNQPLGQVNVNLNNDFSGVTDVCGWYIPYLPPGQYTAVFSKVGYATRTLEWSLEENPKDPILVGLQSAGAPATPDTEDMIDISTITFVNGPNFQEFKLATKLTQIRLTDNVAVEFGKKNGPDRWPDSTTPGWDGPLQYSVGLCMFISGKWYGCAPIEFWHGLESSGGPIQSQDIGDGRGQIEANWFYNETWHPLNTHQPKAGEQLGFFVVAGDPRNNYCPLKERSQIVTFNLPKQNETKTFDY